MALVVADSIILEEGDIIKAQASAGNDLEVSVFVEEIFAQTY